MRIFKDIEQWTEHWKVLRKWVITWTRLKSVAGTPKVQRTLLDELIAEDLAPVEEWYKNDAMLRGTLLEPEARTKYEEITGKKITEIGFCLHETKNYLGLSPDGFEEKLDSEMNPIYDHAVEIKCPGPKNHIKYIKENKIPDDYKWQVINYFLVNEKLETLDFVSYNPDMYMENLHIHIIPCKRSDFEKELKEVEEKVDNFKKLWEKELNDLINLKYE